MSHFRASFYFKGNSKSSLKLCKKQRKNYIRKIKDEKKSKVQNVTIEVVNLVVYLFLVLRALAQITEAAIKIKHLC